MTLNVIYFKVETKIDYGTHIHIEKELFNGSASAENHFNEKYTEVSLAFTQNKIQNYVIALAEVRQKDKHQLVIRIRKAPL